MKNINLIIIIEWMITRFEIKLSNQQTKMNSFSKSKKYDFSLNFVEKEHSLETKLK